MIDRHNAGQWARHVEDFITAAELEADTCAFDERAHSECDGRRNGHQDHHEA